MAKLCAWLADNGSNIQSAPLAMARSAPFRLGTNTDTTSRCGQLPLRQVLLTGWLSNVLNPKPGLFVLAFLPQFVSASRGDVATQMLVYGALFAVLTTIIFSVLGSSAARLSGWLSRHPRVGTGLNVGAGLTFVAAGVSVLAIKARM